MLKARKVDRLTMRYHMVSTFVDGTPATTALYRAFLSIVIVTLVIIIICVIICVIIIIICVIIIAAIVIIIGMITPFFPPMENCVVVRIWGKTVGKVLIHYTTSLTNIL